MFEQNQVSQQFIIRYKSKYDIHNRNDISLN